MAVYGVVTASLVAGTASYVSLDKTVAISVDGQTLHTQTFAASVSSVLHRAGVTVGPHDEVSPALATKVHDGSTISIQRGRELSLTIDGQQRVVWVTASSVDDALQQAGLREAGAVVSADRSARVPLGGMSIDVELPHTMSVLVDGATRTLISTKTSVGAVLTEAGITLNPADQVSVPLMARPVNGMSIVVVRITKYEQFTTASIPFVTTMKNDASILVGTKTVAQQGKSGTLEQTWDVTATDGVPTDTEMVDAQVSAPSVPEVIAVGTMPKAVPKPLVVVKPKAAVVVKPVVKAAVRPVVVKKAKAYVVPKDGLDWAALAACESGGRATANNGRFYGLYQFSLGTWRDVGGTGLPSQASASEQTYRAELLYNRTSWRSQWPTCGSRLFS
jgi:uncharacterized protein YabE (DUF348 family)